MFCTFYCLNNVSKASKQNVELFKEKSKEDLKCQVRKTEIQ